MTRRLEIGCGSSPRAGYEHNDLNTGPDIEYVGAVEELKFPDETFVEVFGTGVIEHLNYEQAAKFLRKAIRWLSPGGVLVLDAPDMSMWLKDLVLQNRSKSSVLTALNGWQRFTGDDHKSFWTAELFTVVLCAIGYDHINVQRESDRNGGPSKEDWHVCVRAYRPFGDLLTVDVDAVKNGWEVW